MYRIGQSSDIHILKKNILHKKLMTIGGTRIDSKYRIKAHSDGDIILHSIAEAIYGALGLGDLGTHFSDTKKENKNLDSINIIKDALAKLKKFNYEIVNIDFTIICQKVVFGNFKDKIIKSLNKILKTNAINFKATRWEESGNKKIQCNAIVLLKPTKVEMKPLDYDRLIEYISDVSNDLTKEVIQNKDNDNEQFINENPITQKITDFINNELPEENNENEDIVDANDLVEDIKNKVDETEVNNIDDEIFNRNEIKNTNKENKEFSLKHFEHIKKKNDDYEDNLDDNEIILLEERNNIEEEEGFFKKIKRIRE